MQELIIVPSSLRANFNRLFRATSSVSGTIEFLIHTLNALLIAPRYFRRCSDIKTCEESVSEQYIDKNLHRLICTVHLLLSEICSIKISEYERKNHTMLEILYIINYIESTEVGYTLTLLRPNKALWLLIKTHTMGKRTPRLLPRHKDQQWSI